MIFRRPECRDCEASKRYHKQWMIREESLMTQLDRARNLAAYLGTENKHLQERIRLLEDSEKQCGGSDEKSKYEVEDREGRRERRLEVKEKEKVLEELLNANFQAQDQEAICLTLSYEGPEVDHEKCQRELKSYFKRLKGYSEKSAIKRPTIFKSE